MSGSVNHTIVARRQTLRKFQNTFNFFSNTRQPDTTKSCAAVACVFALLHIIAWRVAAHTSKSSNVMMFLVAGICGHLVAFAACFGMCAFSTKFRKSSSGYWVHVTIYHTLALLKLYWWGGLGSMTLSLLAWFMPHLPSVSYGFLYWQEKRTPAKQVQQPKCQELLGNAQQLQLERYQAHLSLKQKPGNHDLLWVVAIVVVFACIIITHGITKHEFESTIDALKTEYQNNCTIMQKELIRKHTNTTQELTQQLNNSLSNATRLKTDLDGQKAINDNLERGYPIDCTTLTIVETDAKQVTQALSEAEAKAKSIFDVLNEHTKGLGASAIAAQTRCFGLWTCDGNFHSFGIPSGKAKVGMHTAFTDLTGELGNIQQQLDTWNKKAHPFFVAPANKVEILSANPKCDIQGRRSPAFDRIQRVRDSWMKFGLQMAHLRQVTEMLRQMVDSKNITLA